MPSCAPLPTSRRRCRARRPRRSSRATASTSRRRTRATIRSSWRAAKARWSKTSTATCSSTAPPASRSTAPGHAHPDVVRAIIEQAHKFLHMSGTDFYYEPQVRLAEEMAAIVPVGGGTGEVRSFFSNSGAEANEAALKLARYTTKRVQHHRVPRVVPRPHAGRAGGDVEQVRPAPRLRADDARRVPRAVRELLPVPGRRSSRSRAPAECLELRRGSDPRAPRLARRGRRGARRADPGRGRLRGAAGAVSSAAARADDASTACC